MLHINTSYSICQRILKGVFFLEVCLSLFHQQSDSYGFLLKVFLCSNAFEYTLLGCTMSKHNMLLWFLPCLSHTPFLRIFSLLWKTKVWLVWHVYFFFVLPREYSSDSWFVPDSAAITSFAQLLSSVKDAIRAAQCSVLWNLCKRFLHMD